ncbi:MAG: GNAT family N-acetyltransferase [Cognatishimia sp.]|uniref:GNAT family N-acetyltransferase n=1 Tax=Cognatishimia sp. TaxID=2211648 RepID=UPI003B8B055B
MILPYSASDKDAVLHIWKAASAIAHPFLSADVTNQAEAMIRDQLLDMAEVWMVEYSGQKVGFIAFLGDEIGGLFVLPDYQGLGIGQKLLVKAKEARAELTLSVFTENPKAQGFYQHHGFRETERLTSDFFGHEEIRMLWCKP